MKALLTQQVIVTVEDEEEAGSVAMRFADSVEQGIQQTLEDQSLDRDVFSEYVAVLGVTVSIIPEEVIA